MKKVFFQWWEGPSGPMFTTLHPSRNHARRFRQEVAERKGKGSWKSNLHSKIGHRSVSNRVHKHIMTRLRGRAGIRAFVSDF